MPVLVTTRQINPTDFDAKVEATNDLSAVYADYIIESRYESDRKTYMLSVTSPTGFPQNQDTAAFVKLGGSTTLWVVTWTASRWKEKPKIPDPELLRSPLYDRWVFLDENLHLGNITLGSDGVTPRYRISGVYYYGSRRPSAWLNADAAFPRLPWIDDFATRTVPDDMFVQNLITRA